jgi:chromosome segregation ATPase
MFLRRDRGIHTKNRDTFRNRSEGRLPQRVPGQKSLLGNLQGMTCRDCAYLRKENHRLEEALREAQGILKQTQSRIAELEKANEELRRRLASPMDM